MDANTAPSSPGMTQEIRQKAWRTRPVAASLLRLSAMARPSLPRAALATAAVPGLRVQAARAHTRAGAGLYDAVVVTDTQGHELLVRIPTSAVAEVEQSADLGALRALTPGIRSLLPFTVPRYVGQIPTEDTRAVVTDFLAGSVFSADELTATNRLGGTNWLARAPRAPPPSHPGWGWGRASRSTGPLTPAPRLLSSLAEPPIPGAFLPHSSVAGRKPPTMRCSGTSTRPSSMALFLRIRYSFTGTLLLALSVGRACRWMIQLVICTG